MNKKIKLAYLALVLFLTLNHIYAQETLAEEVPQNKEQGFNIKVSPYFTIGTEITLNFASKETSAPSPVSFTTGAGAVIQFNDLLSLEPRLDFWTMYYLYDGKDALPAEVEHRTASTLCFMLDIPVGFNFHSGAHTFTPGAGLGFLMRFCFLSNGVKNDDKGATGTAKGDVEKISEWFWSDARFLYPEVFFSWDYRVSDIFRAGLVMKVYFPMGSIITGNGLDGLIINITSRFVF